MNFVAGGLYFFPSVPTNSPPLPARKARFISSGERFVFSLEEVEINGVWLPTGEAIDVLNKNGSKRARMNRRISFANNHPFRGVCLVEEPLPAKTIREADVLVVKAMVEALLQRFGVTIEELFDAMV